MGHTNSERRFRPRRHHLIILAILLLLIVSILTGSLPLALLAAIGVFVIIPI